MAATGTGDPRSSAWPRISWKSCEELICHCLDPEAGGYTVSDFPDADLSQDDLDLLLSRL
jgi:hypothetical protein